MAENNKMEQIAKTKICIVCGKEFAPTCATQICCSRDCANQKKLDYNKRMRREAALRRERERMRASSSKQSLAEIDKTALENGMSYGKYVAWLKFQRMHS